MKREEIMEYTHAMRVCYRAKTEENCASCPFAGNGEACDRVNLLDAADVIEGLLAGEDTREPETKEPPEGSGTAYAEVLRVHFDAVYPMGGCTGLGGCTGCPYEGDENKCREVGLHGAADMIDRLWARLLETTKQLEAARGVWVPVDHELPPPGEDVLVCCAHCDCAPWQSVAHREYTTRGEIWATDDGDEMSCAVTHWRTLPPDPEQDGERQELADLLAFAKAIGLIQG